MHRALVASSLCLIACASTPAERAASPTEETPMPPVAKRVPHEVSAPHGATREDPYFWLRSDDRDDPEVLAHLAAENAYAEAALAPMAGLRETIFEEIVARIPKDDASVPYKLGDYWYYSRFEAGKEYPLYCRKRDTLEAPEAIILDANAAAEGFAYHQVTGVRPSPDASLLAWAEDTVSRRVYTIRFTDLGTGAHLDDRIEGTTGQTVWAADNATVLYVRRDPRTLRAHQVWRHRLGTPIEADTLVFDETDDRFYVSIYPSRSRELLMIASRQTLSTEVRYLRADAPEAAPEVLLPREADHEYSADHAHGRFFIRTNWQARDFRLMSVTPAQSADKGAWRVELPARDGVFLAGFALFETHLVANERREGLLGLRVIPWKKAGPGAGIDEARARTVDMPEDAYWTGFGDNPELGSGTLRYLYSSMTTPLSTFDHDLETGREVLLKRESAGEGFDPSLYRTTRLELPARDGALVPVSIVYRADLYPEDPTGARPPQPLLLYGYGSYGYSLDPSFSSARLSLLDRGVAFAIAHIRGGQERGRAWYEDGKLLKKMNTFHDFIDVGRGLVAGGWTAPDRLFAHGGSAGGLLVGAVANMAPELFHGIIAQVPFVDVVSTMLDETIPLTTFEYDEWGNPNDPVYYDAMLAYSPYDNVVAQAYPHMLVLTGLHDSQVQYWEPAKWVARLRHTKTDSNRLIFDTNMDAGHGGGSGRFRRFRETALAYAFLLDLLP